MHIINKNGIRGMSHTCLRQRLSLLIIPHMKMRKIFYLLIVLVIAFTSCKKAYNPIVIANSPNYLVVEGVINNGADSTIIRLSRTVKLASGAKPKGELKAVVTVEDDQNNTYSLKEMSNGNYAAVLSLNNTRTYRLRIKTTDGLVYLSDYEAVKNAPPIDSVNYSINSDGIKINASTHDATNNTRYYRWGFEETWRFQSFYQSDYITTGKDIVLRTPAQNVHYCFASDTSSAIMLGSTAKLSEDVVTAVPITAITSTSEKIILRYSILVKEYALSKKAYDFWDNIRKNTENLGSIFDAQPSAATGNIHCVTNPAQTVIGYISVGTVATKRIFIDKSQLPLLWGAIYPEVCHLDSVYRYSPLNTSEQSVNVYLLPQTSKFLIISYFINPNLPAPFFYTVPAPPPFLPPDGYLSTSPICGDCTVRGKVAAPAFWK